MATLPQGFFSYEGTSSHLSGSLWAVATLPQGFLSYEGHPPVSHMTFFETGSLFKVGVHLNSAGVTAMECQVLL